eukprot:TRINITY_DN378_c0_g1_i1.p1 TRINITY_DN378_c0_g1~~TRINITY_DN378_c0_g1_i1.p1  ORF type:complete len:208 (-),score=80.51 TRINITY_DN378_c0_g1_i1:159-782(-)
MNKFLNSLILLCILFTVFLKVEAGRRQYMDPTYAVELPTSDYVKTKWLLPKSTSQSVTELEEVELLLGVHNSGNNPVSITNLMVTVFRYHSQNYTFGPLKMHVYPGEYSSFSFYFTPSEFEPQQYGIIGRVYYKIDDKSYSSVFANSTIEIKETASSVNIRIFFVTFVLIGLIAGGAYGVKYYVKQKQSKQPTKTDRSVNRRKNKSE